MIWPRKRAKVRMGVRLSRNLDIPAHRAEVRRHNCSVPGCMRTPVDAAHFDGPIPNEDRGGMGQKDSDKWCFPLCRYHHTGGPRCYHVIGWKQFDRENGIDSRAIAEAMWQKSPARIPWERKMEQSK